jgi:DNA-binding transcriptional regulator GbsR (MarR family)
MNWGLVGWFFGVLLTLAALKFVWTVFRTLFSKETMEDVIDAAGDKIHDLGENMTNSMKKAAAKRRAKKKAEEAKKKKEQDKPLVLIQ